MQKSKLRIYIVFLLSICFLMVFNPSWAQKSSKKKKRQKEKIALTQEKEYEVAYYFTEGVRYYVLKDFYKAYSLFAKSYELNPNDPGICYKLAESAAHLGKIEEAISYAEKALSLSSSQNKYYYILVAELYSQSRNFAKSAEYLEQMTEKIPNNTERYLFKLAELYARANNTKKALETYEKAEEKFGISPDISLEKQKIYLQLNQLDKVIEEWERVIEHYPEEPAYTIFLCRILINNNKYTETEQYLVDLLAKEPDHPEALLLMAQVFTQTDREKDARKYIERAFASESLDITQKLQKMWEYIRKLPDNELEPFLIKLASNIESAHPKDARAFAIFGDLYFTLNKKLEARDKYVKSIHINQNNLQVWQNIIQIELENDEYDSVLAHTEQALELFPNQGVLYFFNGTAHLSKKNYQEATFSLEQGKKLSKNNQALLDAINGQLGDTYNSLQKYKKSDEAYEAVLANDPNNPHVLNNYSYFLSLRKEKLEVAKKMSYRLVETNPDNPTYLDTYAWVLYMLEEYKEAKKYLEKAISYETSQNNGTIYEHYGDVLFKLQEVDKAVVQWQKAKELKESSKYLDKKIADRQLYE